jgi:hypothetical protein
MGCDIRAFVEYSFTDSAGSKGFAFWYQVPLLRNYTLFTLMANVRKRSGLEPVSLPKGLPQNLSDEVKEIYEYDCRRYNVSGNHSHSWLSLSELEEVQQRYRELISDEIDLLVESDQPDVFLDAAIAVMRALEQQGREESRLVFSFDN